MKNISVRLLAMAMACTVTFSTIRMDALAAEAEQEDAVEDHVRDREAHELRERARTLALGEVARDEGERRHMERVDGQRRKRDGSQVFPAVEEVAPIVEEIPVVEETAPAVEEAAPVEEDEGLINPDEHPEASEGADEEVTIEEDGSEIITLPIEVSPLYVQIVSAEDGNPVSSATLTLENKWNLITDNLGRSFCKYGRIQLLLEQFCYKRCILIKRKLYCAIISI